MAAALKLSNVSKKYSQAHHWAARHISFEVNEGEILALTGESGCGKTTLLRCISGFEDVQEGEITIHQQLVSSARLNLPAEKRGVSLVFQDLALFPHMTVEQNIAFGLRGLNKSQRINKINEVLTLTDLLPFKNRYPHELSGGQQQRVALARALAVEPKVLLMDEPFSNLDELLKVKVRSEIKRIIKKVGITTIVVSHDAQDAFELADKIAVLKAGELQQLGHPNEIYQNPSNPYVGRFFGEINVIKGRAEDGKVITDYGELPGNNQMDSDTCQVAFRPEAVRVENDGKLAGIVQEIIYRGPFTELIISGPQLTDHVHVRLTRSTFQKNDRITFSVDSSNLLIFRD